MSTQPGSSEVEVSRPSPYQPPSPGNTYQVSPNRDSTSSLNAPQDDIRLCTITRANATDTYGIELNYHRRDQYHSLKVISDDTNTPNSKLNKCGSIIDCNRWISRCSSRGFEIG